MHSDIDTSKTNAALNAIVHRPHINRDEPCQRFKNLIQQKQNQRILHIHGPAGVGKSTLLATFDHIAKEEGTQFIIIDIEQNDETEAGLIKILSKKLGSGPSFAQCMKSIDDMPHPRQLIIAIDHYDDGKALGQWIKNKFIAALPKGVLVVLVSRAPLGPEQYADTIELKNFSYHKIQQYLAQQGIEDQRIVSQVWHYTRGLPLALSLIADAIAIEGPAAITHIPTQTEILDRLVQHWLEEIHQKDLTQLVEAAAVVRCFNQDLLSHITQHEISTTLFECFINTSIVSANPTGWALHDIARESIVRRFKNQRPADYGAIRARALYYFGDIATRPGEHQVRSAALQELFYMLGDGLVRAVLYEPQGYEPEPLHIETATPIATDIDDITDYMNEWREKRNKLSGTKLAFYDREKQKNNQHWIAAEPCEPDLINITEIISQSPGAVRLLRDSNNALRGLSVILPINRSTIDSLSQQPVTRRYFQSLGDAERSALATPPGETTNWFVRLVDVRDEEDHQARASLLKELTNQLTRSAQFITSTPLPFYQSLLMRFGFTQLDIEPHNDFGTDRAAPYFALDLREERFTSHIQQMISMQAGDGKLATLSSQLASMINQRASRQKEELKLYQTNLLMPLTKREREVALLAIEGLANIPIARKLNVTEVTVKKHLGRVFNKLNITSRGELMRCYLDPKPENLLS